MQELFFRLGGLRWDTLWNLMFSLYNRKKTLLSNGRNYGKRKEELNSFELTQVFFGLLSLLSKNFQAKINIFTLIK